MRRKAATVAKMGLTDCYVRPIAWRGSEQMGVSAQKSRINVAIAVWEWGAYYSDLRLTRAHLRPAGTEHRTGARQGRRPLHDLHHLQARRRGQGLRRCADAGLSRLRCRNHRRQRLPGRQDGEIHTPKPDCFLNGITRRTVIDLAQSRGHRGDRAPHHARGTARRAGDLRHRHRRRDHARAGDRRAATTSLARSPGQLIDDYHGLTRGHAKAA